MAIQLRRGLEADLIAGNLLVAEPAYSTDTKRLVIGDGEGGADIIPTGTEVESLIATNAPVRQVYAVMATSGSTVSINITDAALAQQDGLRIGIVTTAETTASTLYQLRVNSGAYVPIVKPTGSTTDYIMALKANTVYELVLVTIGGSLRWVCINYRDDLGVVKQGDWSPVLYGDSVAGTPTYATQWGRFDRIGNTIVCTFNVRLSAIGGISGRVYMRGLPLPLSSTYPAIYDCEIPLMFAGMTGLTNCIGMTARLFANGGLYVGLQTIINSSGNATLGNLASSNLTTATEFKGCLIYRVD